MTTLPQTLGPTVIEEGQAGDTLEIEISLVRELRDEVKQVRRRVISADAPANDGPLDVATSYLNLVDAEERLNARLSYLQALQRRRDPMSRERFDQTLDSYSDLLSGLAVVGGTTFLATVVLLFSANRGQLALIRWSSLLFAVGFFLPSLVKVTAGFEPARSKVPTWIHFVLPAFVWAMSLLEFAAFVFLYVAAVALDFRPELWGGKPPTIIDNPPISEDGNYVPGFVMCGGLIVIGSVWVWAGFAWLFGRQHAEVEH